MLIFNGKHHFFISRANNEFQTIFARANNQIPEYSPRLSNSPIILDLIAFSSIRPGEEMLIRSIIIVELLSPGEHTGIWLFARANILETGYSLGI